MHILNTLSPKKWQWILLPALLLPLVIAAQSNITANRVVISNELALKNYWISSIHNDPSLSSAGSQSIATTSALKAYSDNAPHKRNIGSITRTDSLLTVDRAGRNYTMVPLAGGNKRNMVQTIITAGSGLLLTVTSLSDSILAPTDSLQVTIISNDNIITAFKFGGNKYSKQLAPGRPPFRMTLTWPNSTAGRQYLLNASGSYGIPNQLWNAYDLHRYTRHGDTIRADIHRLYHGIDLLIQNLSHKKFNIPTSIGKRTFDLINQSNKSWLTADFKQSMTAAPGENISYILPITSAEENGEFGFSTFSFNEYGLAHPSAVSYLRYQLYQDDILVENTTISVNRFSGLLRTLDSSCKKVKFIISDTIP